MAADVYLQIDGIKGESQDAEHKGWMECTLADWALYQPGAPGSFGGCTKDRCEYATIDLQRVSDQATPLLLQTCSTGRTLPRARLEVMRADGAKSFKYFVIELEHVNISHVYPSVSQGSPLQEFFALQFAKIKCYYAQQSIAGGMVGRTVGGWDLTTNTRFA